MRPSAPVAATVVSIENEAANRIFSQSESKIALVWTSPLSPPEPELLQVVLAMTVGGKLLNFNRKSTDLIGQVLSRMRISVGKVLKEASTLASVDAEPARKVQKGDNSPIPQPEIQFMADDGSPVLEGTLADVLGVAKSLKIEKDSYTLVIDPPIATSVKLETYLWAGFPVVASWSCTGAPESEFVFEWRVLRDTTNELIEVIVGGQVFVPKHAHVGHFLEVRCSHPKHPQFFLSYSSLDRISTYTGGAREARLDKPLPPTDDGTIRVSTFNILAQPYMRTPLAQDNYYTHLYNCWHLTEWTRRCPLIMREMLDTDSDIYCLQEVASGCHEAQLKRVLEASHDWHFFGKESVANNGKPIGVSISLRRSKFQIIDEYKLNLNAADDGLFHTRLTEVERAEILAQFGDLFFGPVMKGIHTVAGIVHAKHKASGRNILVANTHLFFHPFGGHIRVLQGLCLMRRLKEIQASLGPETGVIVCGDFNSRPDSGSFQVMSLGHIEATHVDWQYGRSFRSEHYASVEPKPDNGTPSAEEDEAATATMVSSAELPPSRGIDVAHGLDIAHVPSSIPELTHATASFRSTLDYIFYSRDVFEATEGAGTGSSIPMLTNAEVDRMGGLPFDHYGSDHVLVAGDIRFK